MKILEKFKSVLVTGVLIVLPAWLAIALFLQVLLKLGILVKPIADHLPKAVNHPTLTALAAFLLICLLVGVLFHTAVGRMTGKMIETTVLKHVPGYGPLRSIAAQIGKFESEHDFRPALIEVEDGCLTPAFIVETHENGLSTVFMPSVPTPMAGSIFIMPSARVHAIAVPVSSMMKCITKWGSGSSILLKALPQTPTTTAP